MDVHKVANIALVAHISIAGLTFALALRLYSPILYSDCAYVYHYIRAWLRWASASAIINPSRVCA